MRHEVATLYKRVAKGHELRSDYGQTLDALDQAFGWTTALLACCRPVCPSTYASSTASRGPASTRLGQKVNVSAAESDSR